MASAVPGTASQNIAVQLKSTNHARQKSLPYYSDKGGQNKGPRVQQTRTLSASQVSWRTTRHYITATELMTLPFGAYRKQKPSANGGTKRYCVFFICYFTPHPLNHDRQRPNRRYLIAVSGEMEEMFLSKFSSVEVKWMKSRQYCTASVYNNARRKAKYMPIFSPK